MINKFIFVILTIIFANKQTELDMQTRSIIEDVFHFGYNPAATFYYLNEFFSSSLKEELTRLNQNNGKIFYSFFGIYWLTLITTLTASLVLTILNVVKNKKGN